MRDLMFLSLGMLLGLHLKPGWDWLMHRPRAPTVDDLLRLDLNTDSLPTHCRDPAVSQHQ